MNIKIQGGGNGEYANTGSCINVTYYLGHEDREKLDKGEKMTYYFSLDEENISPKTVNENIDNNKAKLCNSDSKFFVITVSPSQSELKQMGATQEEQEKHLKIYINNVVMERYATGFGKGLHNKDIMYYGKIHYARGNKSGEQMHAHIIVSRKDITNKIKISPQTNQRTAGKHGTVTGGFDRENFVRNCEHDFDTVFQYDRKFEDSFDYYYTIKKKSPEDIDKLDELRLDFEKRKKESKQLYEKIKRSAQQAREQQKQKQHQQQERQRHFGRGF